ncbi:GlgC family sugar phosphate nucleotidyltransferase [Litchfieldia salsa]|uniref:Glucose-1-phosphate adenylyltransferase n=1 Tax=Litchfieldia salsa TaxID=930152 RepID=A0A1H0QGA0_9BACI|nr:sugar phosphate nucleotidyltransferase [Litchfieldia salsa]SDP16413.1 glucose-1-phosphate adenylyltransferase [Litchfieldia salsa]
MQNKLLGVIDATTHKNGIEDLITNRSMSAIPFAGRYRLIDFVLSSMVNSGIESVAVFHGFQNRSLMDHLGSGREWDLNRKRDGLFFFPSPLKEPDSDQLGSFKQFKQNIDYFYRSDSQYALISNCHTVCNMDFESILQRHISTHSDITEIKHDGQSLEMYIIETSLLIDLVQNEETTGYRSIVDVVRDSRNTYKVSEYEYIGYAALINTIEKYYKYSLEIISPQIWKQLFLKDRPIYTKVKDEPPTRYNKGAVVKNSMIANGCVIEGHVENCILFRGVKIGKGTVVRNSVIMQKSQIGENCELDAVILDKDVKIENGVTIKGTETIPHVLRKGTIQGALMNS